MVKIIIKIKLNNIKTLIKMQRTELKENEKLVVIINHDKQSEMMHSHKELYIDEFEYLRTFYENR